MYICIEYLSTDSIYLVILNQIYCCFIDVNYTKSTKHMITEIVY